MGSSGERTEKDEICFIAFVCHSLQHAIMWLPTPLVAYFDGCPARCATQPPVCSCRAHGSATLPNLAQAAYPLSASLSCKCGWPSPSAMLQSEGLLPFFGQDPSQHLLFNPSSQQSPRPSSSCPCQPSSFCDPSCAGSASMPCTPQHSGRRSLPDRLAARL